MRALLLFAALVTAASAASAQLAPSYSGTSTTVQGSEPEFWATVSELGRCLAVSKTAAAEAFLRTEIGSADEDRAFDTLFNKTKNNSCLRNTVRLRAPRSYIRGALAEGMTEHVLAGVAIGTAPLADDHVVRSFQDFADCYTAAHPDAVASLLSNTRLGTNEERRTVARMAPSFGPCLPEGVEIQILPPVTRLALAEAAYHATRRSAADPSRAGMESLD